MIHRARPSDPQKVQELVHKQVKKGFVVQFGVTVLLPTPHRSKRLPSVTQSSPWGSGLSSSRG